MAWMVVLCWLALLHSTTGQESTTTDGEINPNCTATIANIACDTDGFGTLCDALQLTGLDSDLSTDQWTVFAPTDTAFEALGMDNLDYLWNDTEALTELLLFHVLPSTVFMSSELACQAGSNLLTMANEEDSRTLCVAGIPTFQKGQYNPSPPDAPAFVTKDIETCNGIMHIIDAVLLSSPLPFPVAPEAVVSDPTEAPTIVQTTVAPIATEEPLLDGNTTTTTNCSSIIDLICDNVDTDEDFTALCNLINANGGDLATQLSTGTWTLFAPTDTAMLDVVLPQSVEAIQDILLFHAVPDQSLQLRDLVCAQIVTMANGEPSRTVCDGDVLDVTRLATYQKGAGNPSEDKPEIIQADLLACNGVIHVIDAVMLP